MIETVYSNSYEILRAALIHSLGSASGANPFVLPRIISGSRLINNDLMLEIAREKGICAGIDFWTLDNWFHNYMGFGLGEANQSQDFLWTIWRALDEDFIALHPRLMHYFGASGQKANRALLRYELSKNIATVFYKYVNYRFDWVIEWMYPTKSTGTESTIRAANAPQPDRERIALEANPDFVWQKALWEKLGQSHLWVGAQTLKLFSQWESLQQKIEFEPPELHFFAPLSVSPLMLPVMKLLGEDPHHRVHLYLLNPSQGYWFGSADDSGTFTGDFLRKNASAARALINRFNAFATDSEPVQSTPLPDLRQTSLQALNLSTQAEIVRADLKIEDGTLLHSMQNALLTDDVNELPLSIDTKDNSVRFIKAPTATREVESIVEVIHALFNDPSLPKLKASDILVVTPDIEKATPIIDAVLGTLPQNARIDYRIIGRRGLDANMTAQALLALGDLLMTAFTLEDLEAWLELPIVTKNWNLSLEDLNIIREWLLAAGFRAGLNEAHLTQTLKLEPMVNGFEHEAFEGSFSRALERLAWGYVLTDEVKATIGDILPVNSGLQSHFHTVAKDMRLLKILLMLEAAMQDSFTALCALGEEPDFDALAAWANDLVERFLSQKSTPDELMALHAVIRSIAPPVSLIAEGMNENATLSLPLSVYWRALADQIKEPEQPHAITGQVTFSSLSALKQIPFKVIIAFGMNEDSAFPGTQHFEEFDLMGVDALKRRDDRDSRSDNRYSFLTLILSARERFIASWCVGTDKRNPKNPSPVIDDLMRLITAGFDEKATNEQKKTALSSITYEVPLSQSSESNFTDNPKRYWRGFQTETLQALIKAKETQYQGQEALMVTGPIEAGALEKAISVEEFVRFYQNPTAWVERKLRMGHFEAKALDEIPVIAPNDGLTLSNKKKAWLAALEDSISQEALLARLALDPTAGAVQTRLWRYGEALEKTGQTFTLYKNAQAQYQTIQYDQTETPLPSLHYPRLITNKLGLLMGKDGTLYFLAIATSQAERIRKQLQCLAINYLLKKGVGVLIFDCLNDEAKNKDLHRKPNPYGADLLFEPPSTTLVNTVIRSLCTHLDETIEKITSMPGDYEKENPSILWRGADLDAAVKERKSYNEALTKLLAIWDEGTNKFEKALEEFKKVSQKGGEK